MKWFGQKWDAPICEDSPHVETPVGERCFYCRRPIMEEDRGLTIPHLGETATQWSDEPWHVDCFRQHLAGPV